MNKKVNSKDKSDNRMNNKKINFNILKTKINKLSYEDSLNELNIIINNLQNENISLDEIQENYVMGNIYLSHCEKLLKKVEQNVIKIDPDDLIL